MANENTISGVRVVLQDARVGSESDVWLIFRGNAVLGHIEKFHDTPDTENPYKAFLRPDGRNAPARMIGVFYPSSHGRHAMQRAIDAVITHD
jgi:hypothetical protein